MDHSIENSWKEEGNKHMIVRKRFKIHLNLTNLKFLLIIKLLMSLLYIEKMTSNPKDEFVSSKFRKY